MQRMKKSARRALLGVVAALVLVFMLAGCTGEQVVEFAADEESQTAVTPLPEETGTAIEPSAKAVLPSATATTDAVESPVASAAPAAAATVKPTAAPTAKPTAAPSAKPTATLTAKPTAAPTVKPTAAPTAKPTATPTAKPTAAPTVKPTAAPTAKPTATPTAKPTATQKNTNPLFGSFSAKDVKGNTVTNSVFSGYDVTMVNIWASFCGPCADEMPDLAALNNEYKSRGFQVVGIILDAADSKGNIDDAALADAKDIIARTGADYRHIVPSASMFSAYLNKVSTVPTTVFVNSDGEIIGSAYVGAKSKSKWAAIIEEKLG